MAQDSIVGNDRIEAFYLQFADDTILFIAHNSSLISNALTLVQVFEHIPRYMYQLSKELVGKN